MPGFLWTGINFLAFRRLKIYTNLRPTEHKFFSGRVIGAEPPLQQSSQPVVATAGNRIFRTSVISPCQKGKSSPDVLGRSA